MTPKIGPENRRTRYGRKTSLVDVHKAVDKILVILAHRICKIYCINATTKGQLNSERTYEVIVSPKIFVLEVY